MSECREEKKVLFKDNVLIKTRYNLSAIENKVFNMILYKSQKEGRILKCTITLAELKTIVKKKNYSTVNGIREIIDSLKKKNIDIAELKENGIHKKWYSYNLINGYCYDEEFKTFEVETSEKIYSLIAKKFGDGGYTPINLIVFFSLRSAYSQRIYELLRLWSYTKKKINYTIEELTEYLMLENNYPLYADFKRRVIKPAIAELNKVGCFEISMNEIKKGRKVHSIDFFVEDKDERKYFDKENTVVTDLNKYKGMQNSSKEKKIKCANFTQRVYDYEALEKQLLGWDKE